MEEAAKHPVPDGKAAFHTGAGPVDPIATHLVDRVGETIQVPPGVRLQQEHGGRNRIASNVAAMHVFTS